LDIFRSWAFSLRNSDNGDEKDAFSARQAWPD